MTLRLLATAATEARSFAASGVEMAVKMILSFASQEGTCVLVDQGCLYECDAEQAQEQFAFDHASSNKSPQKHY